MFRLELQYLREIALLKKVTTTDGMVRFVDNEEALTLEQNIKLLPVLTSTLHGYIYIFFYRLINSIVTLITDQVHLNTNHVLFHDMKGELHKFITCEIKKFISR